LTATFGAFAMFLGAYIIVILGIHFGIIQGCIFSLKIISPPFFVNIIFSPGTLSWSEQKCMVFFAELAK